jgi:serine/threonine-protein phosphatase 2A activator
MQDSRDLPPLRHVSLAQVACLESIPTPKIKSDYDVERWKTTVSYQDFGLFLRRLNESVVGHEIPPDLPQSSIQVKQSSSDRPDFTGIMF